MRNSDPEKKAPRVELIHEIVVLQATDDVCFVRERDQALRAGLIMRGLQRLGLG
jgi:hypothetical protein